jgi:hypothetical protein
MAPRVDRPVVRAPRQVELADAIRKDRARDRSATWKDTEIVRPSRSWWFLSLFKGQGAYPPAARPSQTVHRPPGGRLAQLVRALP